MPMQQQFQPNQTQSLQMLAESMPQEGLGGVARGAIGGAAAGQEYARQQDSAEAMTSFLEQNPEAAMDEIGRQAIQVGSQMGNEQLLHKGRELMGAYGQQQQLDQQDMQLQAMERQQQTIQGTQEVFQQNPDIMEGLVQGDVDALADFVNVYSTEHGSKEDAVMAMAEVLQQGRAMKAQQMETEQQRRLFPVQLRGAQEDVRGQIAERQLMEQEAEQAGVPMAGLLGPQAGMDDELDDFDFEASPTTEDVEEEADDSGLLPYQLAGNLAWWLGRGGEHLGRVIPEAVTGTAEGLGHDTADWGIFRSAGEAAQFREDHPEATYLGTTFGFGGPSASKIREWRQERTEEEMEEKRGREPTNEELGQMVSNVMPNEGLKNPKIIEAFTRYLRQQRRTPRNEKEMQTLWERFQNELEAHQQKQR